MRHVVCTCHSCRFRLQEVRYNQAQYDYLLQATQEEWQLCSANPAESGDGFPCLTATSRSPAVAALAQKHVINVFVSGSTDPKAFCDLGADSICSKLYDGYSVAHGPWWVEPSSTWREGKTEENYVFIRWDMFNPKGKNAELFLDGGAATLAHEIGHYLGEWRCVQQGKNSQQTAMLLRCASGA